MMQRAALQESSAGPARFLQIAAAAESYAAARRFREAMAHYMQDFTERMRTIKGKLDTVYRLCSAGSPMQCY